MRRKVIACFAAYLCLTAVFCTGIAAKAEVIHETDLEEYIIEEMTDAHVLGMSASIVNTEKELYCASFGMADSTEYDYVLGDLSKSFTAAGIMHLVEEEELTLKDTVSEYLPEYSAVGEVTVQELLNHTSGIAGDETMSDIQGRGEKGNFEYANANYNLLGEIIEAVTGITYEEYISDNILDPLEMTSTYSLRDTSNPESELIPAYQTYFGFPFEKTYKYDAEDDWMQVPSGYLISDIKDMGKYLQMYLNNGGDLYSQESVEQMLYDGVAVSDSAYLPGDLFDGDATYSMGWMEKTVSSQTVLYHLGIVENYTSAMILLPEKNLGIALLFNSMDSVSGTELIQELIEGVVAIELEMDTADLDGNQYITQHVIADSLMLICAFASWMPIFLMGVWKRRRRNRVFSIPGILIDLLVNIVLPTAILVTSSVFTELLLVRRYAPDIYYIGLFVVASLYLGAVIKLVAMIVFAILGPKEEPEEKENPEEIQESQESQPTAEADGAAQSEGKDEPHHSEADRKENAGVAKPEEQTPDKEKKQEEAESKKDIAEKEPESKKPAEKKEPESKKPTEKKEPEAASKEKQSGETPQQKK
ncbi:MAG: serine hydrolase [Clostridiaceae bacterium]|nr:serine hydrolase [Clostridiaceae bacterium]